MKIQFESNAESQQLRPQNMTEFDLNIFPLSPTQIISMHDVRAHMKSFHCDLSTSSSQSKAHMKRVDHNSDFHSTITSLGDGSAFQFDSDNNTAD